MPLRYQHGPGGLSTGARACRGRQAGMPSRTGTAQRPDRNSVRALCLGSSGEPQIARRHLSEDGFFLAFLRTAVVYMLSNGHSEKRLPWDALVEASVLGSRPPQEGWPTRSCGGGPDLPGRA